MDRYNSSLSCMVFLALIISLSSTVHASGFAASPAKIQFSGVLRGGYAEQELFFNNLEDIMTDIDISVDGEFADWLYFDEGKKFSIQKKSSRYIKIHIEPPADISNGVYEGYINVVSKPRRIDAMDSHGMSIETAISLKVLIGITGEQIVRYGIQEITASSAEEGHTIPFYITGSNTGNVQVSPRVQIDIYNWDRSILMNSEIFELAVTQPTTKKTYALNISSSGLSEGQYWANVSVFVEDKEVSEGLITFDILKKGSLTRNGELLQLKTSDLWPKIGDIVKVAAIFKNSGQVSTVARFRGEVYIEDILVGTLESDELEVPVGSTVNLTSYYTPQRQGRYEIKGSVYYSGKMTYEKGTIINVMPQETLAEKAGILNLGVIYPAIFFILLISFIFYHNRDEGSKEYDLRSVSGRFSGIEGNLEKIIRSSKRMKKKIDRIKVRYDA